MNSTSLRRTQGRLAAAILLGTVAPALSSEVYFGGAEFLPAGKVAGDQVKPALAFGSQRGLLVWQDNSLTTGWSVRGRLLGTQASGIAQTFLIGQDSSGDSVNPSVAALAGGSFLVAWQAGRPGNAYIVAQVVSRDGVLQGQPVRIPGIGTDQRKPKAVGTRDGGAVVVWTATGADREMDAVCAVRLNSKAEPVAPVVRLNETEEFNQRDADMALHEDGSITFVWVSELQVPGAVSSLVMRTYGEALTPTSGERVIVSKSNPVSAPRVAGLPSGLLLAWCEYQVENPLAGWEIIGRKFTPQGAPSGPEFQINQSSRGIQKELSLVATGKEKFLAVYESEFTDGSGMGICGRPLDLNTGLHGEEFVVNSRKAADQMMPTAASADNGDAVVMWVSFLGLDGGTEVVAQRIGSTADTLPASPVPFVSALSSSKLRVTWEALQGYAVSSYLVYVNGSPTASEVSALFHTISGLNPASSHTVRIAAKLADGRICPASATVSGTTWGPDENADGLPDDWQALYFGTEESSWPAAAADTDGDGKSNREEFLSGTSPVDAADVLKTTLSDSPNGRVLTWNSKPGALYQIQFSADLQSWQDLHSVRVAVGVTDSVLVAELPDNVYFRVNYLR